MAKQNVGFGERHLEKFVVGVAGAVLAAMAFLFAVQDPYSIEVSGETLGPGSFYPRLDELASQKLSSLKNASGGDAKDPSGIWKPPQQSQRVSTDIPVVFAAIHPPVPKLDSSITPGGQLDLVGILPPGKPAGTSGRAYASLPPSQVKVISDRPVAAPPSDIRTDELKDVHWVTVFASVPRRAQQEAFSKANYAVDRRLLIVTNTEAERQRMLPSGEWDKPEKVVRTFSPLVLAGQRTLEIRTVNGAQEIAPEAYKVIEMYRSEAITTQGEILRPPLQPALPPESQLDWTVPKSMPGGVEFKWVEDFGVAVAAPEDAAAKEGPGGVRAFDYKKVKAEIDGLITKGKFAEADVKVQEALRGTATLPPNQKKELEDLSTQLQPRIQQETTRLEQERLRRQQIEAASLGADIDLLWVTDLSAEPGETYRYRVRLVALNPNAGLVRKLKNPEDAAKILLTGEWSDWCDPVTLKPSKYLFCTAADPDVIKLELNQWSLGEWDKTSQTVSLGHPLTFQDKLKEFSYEAVPAVFEAAAKWEERNVDPRRGIRYFDPRDTAAILFVRADGEVEEHLVLEDVKKRRDLQSEFAPRNKEGQQQRRAVTPGQMPGPGGPGGPRFPGPGGYPGAGRFRDEG